jgi:hypothetical protein
MNNEPENSTIMQWCFRRVKHRSTVPSSKGPTTVVVALSPPCVITQATARQHWNWTQRPSYGDTSSEMESLLPLRLHTFLFLPQSHKTERGTPGSRIRRNFAIKRGALFSELNRLQPYLAASYIQSLWIIQFSAEMGPALSSPHGA